MNTQHQSYLATHAPDDYGMDYAGYEVIEELGFADQVSFEDFRNFEVLIEIHMDANLPYINYYHDQLGSDHRAEAIANCPHRHPDAPTATFFDKLLRETIARGLEENGIKVPVKQALFAHYRKFCYF